MLLSVHVPKCAGTSFSRILEARFGPRLWKNYGTIFTRGDARPDLVPEMTECIHGHYFADAFGDLFPRARLITWVRHPVERVVSNYHFFRRHPEIKDDCCQAVHRDNLTLRQFAEMDWMRNGTTRYLAGKPFRDFAFVGVAELFADSLDLFDSIFGGGFKGPMPQDNVNPRRFTPKYQLSAEDYGHVLDCNLDDLRWYQQALLHVVHWSEARIPVPVVR